MLSDFHTALAVAKGTGLLPRDGQPDESHSGHTADGYVLRDSHGALLCQVPLEALRSWLPSDGIDHPLSIEAIIGAPTGERWEYCFLLVEFAPQEGGSVLERVLINGQPISTSSCDGLLATAQFHELLNLMGDRGWELATSALRNLDDQGFGRSYSLIFKRRPAD
ncbi:hypothetical protein [Cyanobium sp. ATX 6F1]|uniref:hypothetical protein n=1 Tax=unclassified Cyanobium TaxID=2627006 RepID=UPI0020CD8C53|nr:hypothetical protein [Cyanobium sp. ATX 6F1]MCP9915925.1 hypothetical protein [Cyanobium sp. ATX 6F1]